MTDLNISVTLTEDEVKIAIADYISRKLSEEMNSKLTASMSDVRIDIGTEYEDRPCGSSWPVLKGATITVKKLPPYQDR